MTWVRDVVPLDWEPEIEGLGELPFLHATVGSSIATAKTVLRIFAFFMAFYSFVNQKSDFKLNV